MIYKALLLYTHFNRFTTRKTRTRGSTLHTSDFPQNPPPSYYAQASRGKTEGSVILRSPRATASHRLFSPATTRFAFLPVARLPCFPDYFHWEQTPARLAVFCASSKPRLPGTPCPRTGPGQFAKCCLEEVNPCLFLRPQRPPQVSHPRSVKTSPSLQP